MLVALFFHSKFEKVLKMALRHFKTRAELQSLLELEIAGEKRELPANNFLENALRIALAGEFTATEMEVYGYPENNAQYLFLAEFSGIQYPYIHVRKPTSGHCPTLLNEAVPLVLEKVGDLLEKFGQLLIVGDAEAADAFDRHLPVITGAQFRTLPSSSMACAVFYMSVEQRTALLEEPSNAPAGFTFEPVNVDRDGDTIHKLWKNGISAEITKNRLRYLPSICARTDQGDIAGWAMSARFGQISNLYMLPEYRNRGVGKALELSVAKEFARKDLRVFKYVETWNKSVYEGSLRSPLWTLWTVEDEDNNETKQPYLHVFRRFERV